MKLFDFIRRSWKTFSARVHSKTEIEQDYFDQIFIIKEIARNMRQVLWADNLDKTQSILNLGNYSDLFGIPVENLKDNPLDWLNAIHEDDRPSVEAALPAQLTGNYDVTYRVVHPDGSQRWLHDRAFLIKNSNGDPVVRAGIVEDITDALAIEDQLRQDRKLRAIGALTGGFAHDFNNILAIILGNLELALDKTSSPETSQYLDAALKGAERGASLTHRLLAFSRQQPLVPATIDATQLLHNINHLLASSLGETIELEIITSGGLWKCLADARELETVILNLVINARDAMPEGGKLTLEAFNTRLDEDYAARHTEVRAGQYVCFAVTDNGTGMPETVINQAFDPFFTTKEKDKGTGLGLSMAYGFVKQSQGHIKIYSELGQGTTIKIYLPRSFDEAAPADPMPNKLDMKHLQNLRVLVVEDDDDVRAVAIQHLIESGCVAEGAADARAAMLVCQSGATFDLILTDVVLPGGMNGLELSNSVAKILPHIHAVFMSGYTENAIIHHGRLDPGVTLVQKPFTRKELLTALVTVISRSEHRA